MFTLAPILLLIVLLLFFPPDGAQRSDWAQFIGGFHLLTIHFPIALIFLVPVLEIGGRSRRFRHLRSSVEPMLALAFFSAIASAILGWFLARSGEYSGPLVLQHMWGGFFVTVFCWLCWMLRGRIARQRFDIAYFCGLAVTVLLVSFTGYRGGQLSHGEAHLAEHMPSPLRDWLGVSKQEERGPTAATADSFFAVRVEPVFQQNCVGCHGRSTRKRGLRLDSYEAVMRGGKSGPAVKAADLNNSGLFQRVSSPPGSEKIMPPQGKRPLSTEQIKLIGLWISTGASPNLADNAIQGVSATARPAAEATFTEIDDAAVAKQRAPFADALAELDKRYPGAIEYESRGSAKLTINTSLLGSKFGDDDLARLRPIYDQFVAADFSNSAITDRSASNLAAMKHLRTLRLMHTRITDATVLALGGLNELESLNVFGTEITPAALKTAEHLPKLRHLYAGETKITANRPLPDALKGKVVF
ncbi:MAG TPA: c-type cytochrome domain-containing protein [Terracidiphilus sp.]|jgi:mono/diheme cytochrome c family protein|nr:c-type cytochrome domain-containing protein [Terracidiphilus sp.]